MASTEAQKRASAKYQKLHTKQVNLKFSPNEMHLWEHVQEQAKEGTASGYIKRLIAEDLARKTG